MTLWRFLLLALAALTGLSTPAQAQQAPGIAAASDLRPALTELAATFQRQTGQRVRLTFGSSGNFHRQLQQGAPFEMFLSADEGYVQDLHRRGLTRDGGALYAVGRLALVAPKGSPLKVDGNLAGLRAALVQRRITRFAMANPVHAPYGKAAQQALAHAGLWAPLKGRLVLGENVSQALQFASGGGAQGGIVAYSLVRDPAVAARVNHALIPASWHAPLRQRMVLMQRAGPVARQFYTYMQGAAARQMMARYGFSIPRAAPAK